MSAMFGKKYAAMYDGMYQTKDYEKECSRVEALLRKYSKSSVKKILDLGCGTGNHLIPLAKRGHEMTGVDRSAFMLSQAKEKARVLGLNKKVKLVKADIRHLKLGKRFDAALMMFAVLGYHLENKDVMASLKAVRRHLKKGSYFIFDFWYGPAVISAGPSRKAKWITVNNKRIHRVATGTLDTYRNLCRVDISLSSGGKQKTHITKETHFMRYFFSRELELFLEQAGFSIQQFSDFSDFKSRVSEKTWNIIGIAKAV